MKVKIKTHLKTLLKINQNLQTVINQKMIKTKRLKMNLIMIKTTLIKRTIKHKIIKIKQQANQNQQQQQQRQGGGQRHTVNGQENLYRIAIQYYGSGSPENVEKN